jgi:Adenylate cyclase, family 3 (some proteins contain HAMP domain)
MRDALPSLGVQARIGVNTGEVVAGTSERLGTGDAVNVAARLEQAAPPHEVYVGARTVQLARGAVEVEPVEPLELKGKSQKVEAFRLVSVTGPEAARRMMAAPSSVASANIVTSGKPSTSPCPTERVSCSRCSVSQASESPGWSRSSYAGSTRLLSMAGVLRTARASPTGPWSRRSSNSGRKNACSMNGSRGR